MMNNIGRKIFFEKSTGNVIVDTGERTGAYVEQTSIEQDIEAYTALSQRNADSFNVIEIPFGAFAQDFTECNGYRINVETKTLEFSYPDPNEPEVPPVFVNPLTEKIKEVENQANATSADLQEFMEHYFTNGGI